MGYARGPLREREEDAVAQVVPDGWQALQATGAAARERETLALLAGALPAAYTVYHAVHWTRLEDGFSVFGQVDFIVVNAAGELLLIEQKNGFLEEGAHGLVRREAGRVRQVGAQVARDLQALQSRLGARLDKALPRMEYLFYCPDFHVRSAHTAGLAPERIIDARRRDALVAVVREVLPVGEAGAVAREVHRFLRDLIQIETDVSALMGRARALVTRVSGGLAQWARALEFEPFRLRVLGTAGSGKTQLALAEYGGAIRAGRRPLYVCFNRPLADHMAAIVPAGGLVCTFHHLCERLLAQVGMRIDYAQADAFERLVQAAAAVAPDETLLFDSLVVDEGQDFPEAWKDMLLRHVREGARMIWLEDPLQNLYARAPVSLPGWVSLHARSNYRSPRPVVRMLRELLPELEDIESAAPFDGGPVEWLEYEDGAGLQARLKEAVRRCFSAGYRAEDTVILSWRGREHSELLRLPRLGGNVLRSFSGRYDLLGQPEYSPGELRAESLYRFKGQSAPAVILAEVDFDALDTLALRKFFVGATRAMMKLVVVASSRASAQLRARTGQI